MRMATIITLYKQPKLAEMILRAMQHEGFHFYLHIDKKVDSKPFEYLKEFPNTFFLKKRWNIKWAGYSMVDALVSGMKEALESGIHYDFINHISGQDHPIKPAHTIHDFFDQYKGKNFLSCEPAPSDWWEHARTRYEKYHFQDVNFKGKHRLATFLTQLLPKRKLPFPYKVYGGSLGAYWTISQETARYLVSYLDHNNKVRKFFKLTWGPDEFLFNTLIMNSDFSQHVINKNYRYIDWSEGAWHPKILTLNDFERLQRSDCFFARKFDLTVDTKILEMVANNLVS